LIFIERFCVQYLDPTCCSGLACAAFAVGLIAVRACIAIVVVVAYVAFSVSRMALKFRREDEKRDTESWRAAWTACWNTSVKYFDATREVDRYWI